MKQVAADVKAATNGRLDIVAITHEHWDHLSGFDQKQARAIFAGIKIDALWLGWPEDETDDLARSLREERKRKREAATAAIKAAKDRGLDRQSARLAELMGFFGARAAGEATPKNEDEDVGGTAGALNFLKDKCAPSIKQTGSSFEIPGLSGVRVYVVGPPKDAGAMRKTAPYKGEGYGLGDTPLGLADAFLAGFDPNDERAQPFGKEMRRPLTGLKAAIQSPQATSQPGIEGYYQPASKWRNIDDAWLATGERLALQLDNATNNTSLVLAIELGGEDVLLFVGDAQAGNWRSWEPRTWRVKERNGVTRRVTSTDLLNRTIFYKVGHHGSHNATLREKGLELMKSNRLAAFIPVDLRLIRSSVGLEVV